jgi:flavorubredoxin
VSDEVRNAVVIPYVSMHHSTKIMTEYLVDALISRGITVKPFNLTVTDIGELAMALVDAATVVIGTPTVLVGPHPLAAYAALLANALRPKLAYASVIGSYGWGGKAVETIAGMLPNLKVEILDPVLVRGIPREETFRELDRLADDILRKHRERGITS